LCDLDHLRRRSKNLWKEGDAYSHTHLHIKKQMSLTVIQFCLQERLPLYMVNPGINFYTQATIPRITDSCNELTDVPFVQLQQKEK